MSDRKKIVRSTHAQIKALVDYMSTNPSFANGDFSGPLGSKRLQDEWEKVREVMKEYGPDKTVEQWKQTWKDLKKKARHDNAATSLAQQATGNNKPVPPVSEITNKVLGTIGYECSTGVGPEESPISSGSQACMSGLENARPVASVIMTDVESENMPPPPQLGPLNAESPSSRPRMQTQRTNPYLTTQNRVVSEFASLQEENNHLLKVIDVNLCDLMAASNAIQQERNGILRERNRILKRK